MASVSIRKNDQVVVQTGRDKGKQGRVLKVLVSEGRAIVEGVNRIKRHTRANPGKNVKGGVVEREAALHVSNLLVICPECSKATRVKRKLLGEGKRQRVCKKCSGVLDRSAAS